VALLILIDTLKFIGKVNLAQIETASFKLAVNTLPGCGEDVNCRHGMPG